LQPNRQSSTSTCKESSINSSCQHSKFEFKQEGTKIQFNFNSERIDSLESISSLISQCKFDDTRAFGVLNWFLTVEAWPKPRKKFFGLNPLEFWKPGLFRLRPARRALNKLSII
jgi:hypothetical protein